MTNTKSTTEEKQIETRGIVNIHGRDYMTVARRVELAHEEKAFDKLDTEILNHDPVVIKATITIKGKEYTGISAVDPQSSKLIEKQNPYEVAETSAVGRALGFAGFGIIEGIASADEVTNAIKRQPTQENHEAQIPATTEQVSPADRIDWCAIHNKQMKERFRKDGGSWHDHRWQVNGVWQKCNGKSKDEEDEDLAYEIEGAAVDAGY